MIRRLAIPILPSLILASIIALGVNAEQGRTIVLLPLLQTSLTAPRELPHPAGIDCFEKQQPIAEDRAGKLFVTCQANNHKGQVVWFIDGGEAHVVFTGGSAYAGPGELAILRNGQLVLSTVGKQGSNTSWIVPVDGWTP